MFYVASDLRTLNIEEKNDLESQGIMYVMSFHKVLFNIKYIFYLNLTIII